MMALTLALLCLFTIGAGAAVARLLPPRLALFQLPTIWAKGLASPGTVLRGATGSPSAESGGEATAAGVSASVDGLIKSGNLRSGCVMTPRPSAARRSRGVGQRWGRQTTTYRAATSPRLPALRWTRAG